MSIEILIGMQSVSALVIFLHSYRLAGIEIFPKVDEQPMLGFREPLPEDCPPDEAAAIVGTRIVLRLVRSNPPTLEDFRSQRAEKPKAIFHGVSECQARGLSVFANRDDAERASKLPVLRGRLIWRVRLSTGAGRFQQTGRGSHHTWWPLAEFDILAHCDLGAV